MSVVNTNPALRRGFDNPDRDGWAAPRSTPIGSIGATPDRHTTTDTMTLRGTAAKTAICLAVLVAAGAAGWAINLGGPALLILFAATIGITIAIISKPRRATGGAVIYAVLEGLLIGAISKGYADGKVIAGAEGTSLVWSAFGLTIAITAALLAIYATGRIRPSANFKLAVSAATLGIGLYYLATILASFFGVELPLVHSNSLWGIVFSLFVVALASACLVVDFDFIEQGVADKLPKHMEWYGAFGLMITLVWLYLELLRLLAKLQSRR